MRQVVVPKTDAEATLIRKVLQENYVFADLDSKMITDVVEVMKPLTAAAEEDIITQVKQPLRVNTTHYPSRLSPQRQHTHSLAVVARLVCTLFRAPPLTPND